MKAIGGFFELEIADGDSLYHDGATKLATGRACLNLILQIKKYNKIFIPYYCCNALFEPMVLLGINYEFYSINENFEINDNIYLGPNDVIIYCNFFGLKSNYVNKLIAKYEGQIIVDDTHSFFTKGYHDAISFTTARKYFGVPDGAFLYYPEKLPQLSFEANNKISVSHNVNRLIGHNDLAYEQYTAYEDSLDSSINKISLLSEKILKTVNYLSVQKSRNENFDFYHEKLETLNQLNLNIDTGNFFCYPLLLSKPIDKQLFFDHKIFIPSYWPDVINRIPEEKYSFEYKISKELLPLPIDHRYNSEDLGRVISLIKNHL